MNDSARGRGPFKDGCVKRLQRIALNLRPIHKLLQYKCYRSINQVIALAICPIRARIPCDCRTAVNCMEIMRPNNEESSLNCH
jgi:hypothetical protein